MAMGQPFFSPNIYVFDEPAHRTYSRWTETGVMCALRNAKCEGCPVKALGLEALDECHQAVSNSVLLAKGIRMEDSLPYRNWAAISASLGDVER